MKYQLTLLLLIINSLVDAQNYESLIEKAESFESGNPDSILFYAKKAVEFGNNNLTDAYYWTAVGLRFKNNYDSAKYWYLKSLNLAKTDLHLANINMGLGGISYSNREYDQALNYFMDAADYFEKTDNQERLGSALINVGIIMNINDNDEKAIHYFRKSIDIFETLNLDSKKLPALVNLASVYQKNEMYDSAIFYGQQCFDLSEEQGFAFGMAKSLVILGPSYTEMGDPQKGYELCQKGRLLFEQMGAEETVRLMKVYEAEALLKQNRLQEALSITKELELLNLELSMKESLLEVMAAIYQKMGKYELALIYQQKFHDVYAEYLKKEQSEHLNELEAKFESERKANEIAILQNEVSVKEAESFRKNWIIASIVGITLLVLISLWLLYQRRLSLEKERSAIHKQQLLRSQINPHFIFNSLSSIRGFLFEGNDTKPAITYLGKFAKLMRMVLELSSKEWVTLAEELKALELYLEIQQIRFNKAFDFNLTIDPLINTNEIIVPPLTAQPFIENAIEHGLKGMDRNGMVEIACLKEHGKLVFRIQDNGIGINHVEPRKNHQSRAIHIFKERLGIIGKRMKTSFSFSISDIGNNAEIQGTLVTYELPLIKA